MNCDITIQPRSSRWEKRKSLICSFLRNITPLLFPLSSVCVRVCCFQFYLLAFLFWHVPTSFCSPPPLPVSGRLLSTSRCSCRLRLSLWIWARGKSEVSEGGSISIRTPLLGFGVCLICGVKPIMCRTKQHQAVPKNTEIVRMHLDFFFFFPFFSLRDFFQQNSWVVADGSTCCSDFQEMEVKARPPGATLLPTSKKEGISGVKKKSGSGRSTLLPSLKSSEMEMK